MILLLVQHGPVEEHPFGIVHSQGDMADMQTAARLAILIRVNRGHGRSPADTRVFPTRRAVRDVVHRLTDARFHRTWPFAGAIGA